MIPVFGADASSGNLLSLDDPRLDTDRGVAFVATVTPAVFAYGGVGMSTLRTFFQAVKLDQAVTLVATPETDGVVGLPQTFDFVAADGQFRIVKLDLMEQGQKGTVTFAVTAHQGITELGDASQLLVARRTIRAYASL